MSLEAVSELDSTPSHPLFLQLAAAAICAALADWLFFGWQAGISLALFFAVIGVVAVAVNGVRAQRRAQIIMTSVFVAGLLALIEEVTVLRAENRELRDEIARLKGLPPRPKFKGKPSGMAPAGRPSMRRVPPWKASRTVIARSLQRERREVQRFPPGPLQPREPTVRRRGGRR